MGPHGLLIIGNGGAAVSAVMGARDAGYSGAIHLVSDTEGGAFNPMLSPYYLAGKIPFDSCFPFGREFYKKYAVTCHLGTPAEKLKPIDKELTLKGGKKLTYDRCLIATGASPFMPGIPGLKDSKYVFTLRTAEDTVHLKEALSRAGKVLILGASLIGIKMAEVFTSQGLKVTLADIAEQVLPGAAHSQCAAFLKDILSKKGVDVRLGWNLEGVEDGPDEAHFHFKGRETVAADFCLAGIGIKPNLEFLRGSQIGIDQGILVNHMLRTNIEDIYAAGDVSQGMNLLSGKKEMIGLWGNACYQGRAAGINMAGRKATYRGAIPDHVSAFFGITFVHLGDVNRQGEGVKVLSNDPPSDEGYHLLVFDRGALKGVNLINDVRNAGKLKTAIRRKFDWSGPLNRFGNALSGQGLDRALAEFEPMGIY